MTERGNLKVEIGRVCRVTETSEVASLMRAKSSASAIPSVIRPQAKEAKEAVVAIVASQILRFGVGFYSTFVVADKVEVRLLPGITVKMSSWYQTRETQVYTKTADKEKGEKGYLWTSDGPEPSKVDTAWQSFLSRPKTKRSMESNKSFFELDFGTYRSFGLRFRELHHHRL